MQKKKEEFFPIIFRSEESTERGTVSMLRAPETKKFKNIGKTVNLATEIV